jgi:hypothetical protein
MIRNIFGKLKKKKIISDLDSSQILEIFEKMEGKFFLMKNDKGENKNYRTTSCCKINYDKYEYKKEFFSLNSIYGK